MFTLSTTLTSGETLLRATPANTNTTFYMTYMRLPAYKDGTLAATTTSQQVMDSNSTGHDGLKYTITATHASAGTHACELVLSTDGTNSYFSQYGDVITNASLFSIATDVASSMQRVLVTPVNTNTTFVWDVTKRGN